MMSQTEWDAKRATAKKKAAKVQAAEAKKAQKALADFRSGKTEEAPASTEETSSTEAPE